MVLVGFIIWVVVVVWVGLGDGGACISRVEINVIC